MLTAFFGRFDAGEIAFTGPVSEARRPLALSDIVFYKTSGLLCMKIFCAHQSDMSNPLPLQLTFATSVSM